MAEAEDGSSFASECKDILLVIGLGLDLLFGLVEILLVKVLIKTEVAIAEALHQTLHVL